MHLRRQLRWPAGRVFILGRPGGRQQNEARVFRLRPREIASQVTESLEWTKKPRNPREMRVRYSFVIDQNPRFLAEGELFLRVLLAAGVAPQDIVAQTTVRSGERAKSLVASFGVRAVDLPLGPDACAMTLSSSSMRAKTTDSSA